MWGDVPYSEALKGDAAEVNIVPAYDPQQAIYDGLFADLSEAVTAIAAGGAIGLGNADPIYQGNALRWQRFGIRCAARHAIRLANVMRQRRERSCWRRLRHGEAHRPTPTHAHGLAGRRSYDTRGRPQQGVTITGSRIVVGKCSYNDPRGTGMRSRHWHGGFSGNAERLPREGVNIVKFFFLFAARRVSTNKRFCKVALGLPERISEFIYYAKSRILAEAAERGGSPAARRY